MQNRQGRASQRDIQTIDDIRVVVDAFYRGIEHDPVLRPYFAGLDMRQHLSKMYAFWSSVVFHTGTYRGRPFEKHAALEGLKARHFQHWLSRFESTVDACFAGPRAEEMKSRARHIATIFQAKLGLS